jgi:sugar O-acyltransferase (sialic acid O-acetyltransferase NeuD family)
MNEPVIIIGAGGHAAVLVDALLEAGVDVLGLTDADPRQRGAELLGCRILGGDDALAGYAPDEVRLVNGIGSTGDSRARRAAQVRLEQAGWRFTGVRHPRAVVSRTAQLDVTVQVMAGAVIQPRARTALGCIVNTGAVVEHDVELGEYVHVAPGAVICGTVRIAERCHVGAGAVIRQGLSVGADTLVAAGAVVVADHAGGGVLAGVPARARRSAS